MFAPQSFVSILRFQKSVIAKGKRAKVSVFKGSKAKTSSGLKKSDLKKNKNGKIVSAKKSAAGKKVWLCVWSSSRAWSGGMS